MAGEVWGLDPEEVHRLGREFQVDAQELRLLADRVAKRVVDSKAEWMGADADRFREEWLSRHHQTLMRVGDMLADHGRRAQAQASEQRAISQGW